MAEPEAYYNENEPYAAEWLRNLIANGHIPPGYVDERDIREVTPAELVRFTQCHFFAGVGIWPLALRSEGWPDWRPIWTGSAPCQPFSLAGKGDGFDDERHLWPAWHWLIQNQPPEHRPEIIVGEQVSGTDGLGWFDLVSADLGGIGYASGAVDLSAAGFGMGWRGSAEQERLERTIWDCPDSMVARHMADFAHWADQALGIGGFHIRQRLYFIGLAYIEARRWGKRRDALESGASGHPNGSGITPGRVANGASSGSGAGLRDHRSPEQRGLQPADHGSAIGLEHGQCPGLEGLGKHGAGTPDEGWIAGQGKAGSVAAAGESGGLDNGVGIGLRSGGQGDHPGDVGQQLGSDGGDGRAASPHGEGGDVDWLFCRDGVWRPTRSGSFPLVNAAPQRVGRLRAYGNGLDLETARGFIRAVKGMLHDLESADL